MNNVLKSMMKPLPKRNNDVTILRPRQEDYVLEWLETVDCSVNSKYVATNCHDIPGISGSRFSKYTRRGVSNILQRLERKGRVISTLYGSYRYYSIPVMNGGEN